jgi:adenine-specific DNA-methyltransferase
MLAENIKQFRYQQGLTQKELSDNSGVKYTTLTKLETGFISNPSVRVMYQLALALNTNVENLLEGESYIEIDTFEAQNRRFLGNKYKLLDFIDEVIQKKIGNFTTFFDAFAGTGVVGLHFNSRKHRIISNDFLKSNYIPLQTFLATKDFNRKKIVKMIKYLNQLTSEKENYFSKNFGGTYFTKENAKKIGAIREKIEELAENKSEKYILLTSLLYATDKVANTVGHYDAYRKQLDTKKSLKLQLPKIQTSFNKNNTVYCMDANNLVPNIDTDILYIDPPYNSRQYSDTYHLLENLMLWEKPSVYGKAKKMDRSKIKSEYCFKSASRALRDLIKKCNAKHIILSYNNTGKSKHSRSNARISDEEIKNILSIRGEVEVFRKNYKSYTAGKSSTGGNEERLFYCKVTK